MKIINLLYVPEDDVFLVDNRWWDLLHAASHLPQVRLHEDTQTRTTKHCKELPLGGTLVISVPEALHRNHSHTRWALCHTDTHKRILTSKHSCKSLTYAFSVCRSSAIIYLWEDKHTRQWIAGLMFRIMTHDYKWWKMCGINVWGLIWRTVRSQVANKIIFSLPLIKPRSKCLYRYPRDSSTAWGERERDIMG